MKSVRASTLIVHGTNLKDEIVELMTARKQRYTVVDAGDNHTLNCRDWLFCIEERHYWYWWQYVNASD